MKNVIKTTVLTACLLFIGFQVAVPVLADNFHTPSGDIAATGGYISGTGVSPGDIDLYTNNGRLLISRGTAGNPSISIGPDDDGSGTGFFSSGPNVLSVQTNGVSVWTWQAGSMYQKAHVLMNNNVWIGGSIGTGVMYGATGYQTNPTIQLRTGSLSNSVLIGEYSDVGTNYSLPVYTDPTVAIASNDATDTSQVGERDWRRISLGGRGGGLCGLNQTWNYWEMTDGGGNSGTLVLDETIPDASYVLYAVLHTLTGFTGDVSAVIQIGDGVDVDRYNTGTPNVFVSDPSGVDLGVPSGTQKHSASASVTVTITTNADFTSVNGGKATIIIVYVCM